MLNARALRFSAPIAALTLLLAGSAQAVPFFDPSGDTLGVTSPQLDIELIDATAVADAVNGDFLLFTIDFYVPISPNVAPADPNAFLGSILIDSDQNDATGTSFLGLDGFDWIVQYGTPQEDGGGNIFVPVEDQNLGDGDQSFLAPVVFGGAGDSTQLFLLLSAIADDGFVDYFVIATNGTPEITDIAGQDAFGAPAKVQSEGLSVPEPAALTLLGLGLLALRRRR